MYRLTFGFLSAGLCLLSFPAIVSAGPILCPGTAFSEAERQFTVTTASGTAGCVSWGTGNIGGHDDEIGDGWRFLDKDSSAAEDVNPFSITGAGATSGTFTVHSSVWTAYTALAIAFKTGNNMNPSWAAFALPVGALTGTWNISSNGLSHANLYATGFLGGDDGDGDGLPADGDGGPGDGDGNGDGDGSGDGIPSVATPEPATLALFGTGLLLIRAFRRRR